MKLLLTMAVVNVLAQAVGAVVFLLAGHWVLGGLLAVGAIAVAVVAVRISRSVGRTSPSVEAYSETTRAFY